MTPTRLAALRNLLSHATPGTWRTGKKVGRTLYVGDDGDGKLIGVMDSRDDAAWVAAARTALPECLDEIERLRACIGENNSLAKENAQLEQENNDLREQIYQQVH